MIALFTIKWPVRVSVRQRLCSSFCKRLFWQYYMSVSHTGMEVTDLNNGMMLPKQRSYVVTEHWHSNPMAEFFGPAAKQPHYIFLVYETFIPYSSACLTSQFRHVLHYIVTFKYVAEVNSKSICQCSRNWKMESPGLCSNIRKNCVFKMCFWIGMLCLVRACYGNLASVCYSHLHLWEDSLMVASRTLFITASIMLPLKPPMAVPTPSSSRCLWYFPTSS